MRGICLLCSGRFHFSIKSLPLRTKDVTDFYGFHLARICKRLSATFLIVLTLSACGGSDGVVEDLPDTENGSDNPQDISDPAPNVVSAYLQDPDEIRSVIASLADFRTRARDNNNGGFYSYLTTDGSLGQSSSPNELSTWVSTNKSMVTQTRDIYTFSRAFMVTGELRFLEQALHAYDFLLAHGRDDVNGGWYFVTDVQGNPADCPNCSQFWNPNSFKWSFVQHYIPLGLGALCEATREESVCRSFTEAKNELSAMRDPVNGGYFEQSDADYSNPQGKSFASTVDALNTHAFFNHQNGADLSEIIELATLTVDKFIGSFGNDSVAFGFPDIFTADWMINQERNQGSVGHLLKASWMLARTYLLTSDGKFREAAMESIDEVLNNGGWDDSNGVPLTSFDWETGEIDSTNAEYWQIEQAVNAGLSTWYITRDMESSDRFLNMADRALLFFQSNVIDWSNGGTYALNAASGNVVNSDKGSSYKAEFHSVEMFYYTYLYAHLMLNRSPATLYYSIAAVDESAGSRQLQFNPLEIDNQSLSLLSATLNGSPVESVDKSARRLELQASDTGILALVFGAE